MAIHDASDVATLLGTPEQSTRINNFVWVYLSQVVRNPGLWTATHYPQQLCWELLNRYPECLKEVQQIVSTAWIPERDLRWLTDSDRQVSWVHWYIKTPMRQAQTAPPAGGAGNAVIEEYIPHHLTGSNRTIALIDYWSSRATEHPFGRRAAIQAMESAWSRQQAADRRFDWLDSEDGADRRAYFWEKLLQHFPVLQNGRPLPESHGTLLNALDDPRIHPSELTLFNQKTKGLFQQQQRRASSTGRRQCNFVLQEKTVSKLEKLARKHGITRTEVIDLLIQEETANPVHTTERLRRIRALTSHA